MIQVRIGAHAASLVQTDGETATLQAGAASPPGSLLAFSLAGSSYRVKVRSCRRSADGDLPFRIDGRLLDLTREERQAIVRAVTASG